jgi:hypothetical protein
MPDGLKTAAQAPPGGRRAGQTPPASVPPDLTDAGGLPDLPVGMENPPTVPAQHVPLKQSKTRAAANKLPVTSLGIGAALVLGGVLLLAGAVRAVRRRRELRWEY